MRNHTQYLLARVITLLALELLLILMGPLVLNEGIALMEASGAVSAPDLLSAVAVQVAQMDTCKSRRRRCADLWRREHSGTSWVGSSGY